MRYKWKEPPAKILTCRGEGGGEASCSLELASLSLSVSLPELLSSSDSPEELALELSDSLLVASMLAGCLQRENQRRSKPGNRLE